VPVVSDVSRGYWQACKRGVLVVQECGRCGGKQLYPRSICHHCHARELTFVEAAGTGEVVSFTVVHRAASAAFEEEVPYILAMIELDEGPRMLSTVTADGEDVVIGSRVRAWFDAVDDEIALPKFRLL
jgi:hypothetical protein